MPHSDLSTQTLSREAMATVFTITVAHAEPDYARQAIRAALDELDLLEDRLSRFRPSSDVARINRLQPGQKTTVAPETLACLQAALAVESRTGRALDIAYASAPSAAARIELGPAGSTVRVLVPGVRLDLGGIGKGFAIDRMATVLAEWDIEAALLWASTSTVLAVGTPPGGCAWSVWIGPEDARRSIRLVNRALSASGVSTQGHHIVDPRSGRPAARRARCWAEAPTAAEADALSTAFIVMSQTEITRYCLEHPEASARAFDVRGGDFATCSDRPTRT